MGKKYLQFYAQNVGIRYNVKMENIYGESESFGQYL